MEDSPEEQPFYPRDYRQWSPDLVSCYDELPLWSAQFGSLLLKHVPLRANCTYVDIGSGTGFPLLELAERLGNSSKCIGVDIWSNANDRVRKKINEYGIQNVVLLDESADNMSISDASVDHIVSNLGINNFSDPAKAFRECHRILKDQGTLTITTNLTGHWKEFYAVIKQTVISLNMPELVPSIEADENHRGTLSSVIELFTNQQFTVVATQEETFEMKYLNGAAFLNHHFVKLGWISGWRSMVPRQSRDMVFSALAANLDALAATTGGELVLTVPMLVVKGVKGSR